MQAEFARNFSDRGEVGAGICVFVGGSVVVDLVGGWADGARQRPWRHDTLVDMYSAGKPFVALLALLPSRRGAPRARCAGGLGLARVHAGRQGGGDRPPGPVPPGGCPGHPAPAHQRRPVGLGHHGGRRVAATEPWWEPGTRHTYHTNTYGHLVGELARRTGHGSCGRQLAELAAPLKADVHFGVPSAELRRCAEVLFASPGDRMEQDLSTLEGDMLMEMTSYVNPPGYSSLGVVNTERWRQAEVPSTNGTPRRRVSPASTPPCWSRVAWCPQTCWARRRRRSRRGSAHPARRGDLRPRLPAHHTTSSLRPQPGQLRSFRDRRRRRIRRPGSGSRRRLRDERRDPSLAEHTQPGPHRGGVRVDVKRGRSDYIDPACDRRSTAGPPRPSAPGAVHPASGAIIEAAMRHRLSYRGKAARVAGRPKRGTTMSTVMADPSRHVDAVFAGPESRDASPFCSG